MARFLLWSISRVGHDLRRFGARAVRMTNALDVYLIFTCAADRINRTVKHIRLVRQVCDRDVGAA